MRAEGIILLFILMEEEDASFLRFLRPRANLILIGVVFPCLIFSGGRACEARGSVMYATAAGAVKLVAHSPEGENCKIGLRYL